jgi:RND family efflux transporter MFP subunit
MKRTTLIFLILLSMQYLGCKPSEKKEEVDKEAQKKPPAPVEAVKVAKGNVSREISASGVAAGIQEAYVASETQGKIEKVNFNLGQRVTQGQMLVLVNETIQKAAYEQAKKALEAADLNLRVTQKLHNEENASDAELTNAQTQATGAKAQLESTKKALYDCRIRAPISGFIAQKNVTIEKGNLLAGGTAVTRIVNISSLKTTISVGEMEIGSLKKGMTAKIVVPAIRSKTLQGRVNAISAGSDPATGSYPVEILWNNIEGLKIKSGMSVFITIPTKERDSVILIPALSIVEIEKKEAVFLSVNNKASIRFLSPGRSIKNHLEIIDGLKVGEILLTTGRTSLARGDSLLVVLKGESTSL